MRIKSISQVLCTVKCTRMHCFACWKQFPLTFFLKLKWIIGAHKLLFFLSLEKRDWNKTHFRTMKIEQLTIKRKNNRLTLLFILCIRTIFWSAKKRGNCFFFLPKKCALTLGPWGETDSVCRMLETSNSLNGRSSFVLLQEMVNRRIESRQIKWKCARFHFQVGSH